jgi:hypothetical protein
LTKRGKNRKLLVVINSSRGDAVVDKRYAAGDEILLEADCPVLAVKAGQ